MKRKTIITALPLLLAFLLLQSSSVNASASRIKEQLVQNKWKLERKAFSIHDQNGTDSMAVAIHKDDFIEFKADGTAVVSFNGNKDVIQYELLNDTLLSFGNTPYRMQILNGILSLFQNEEEANGDYNREWLELKKR